MIVQLTRVIAMSFYVKDYMSKEVPTIEDRASVTEAAKTMSELDKGFLIVLKAGRPTGIATVRDLVNKVMARELDPAKVSVGEIMSSPLISIDPDEDLLKASEVMQEHDIRQLPVVKEGIIYGVLTSDDIATQCRAYVDKSVRDIMKWSALL